MSAGSPDLERDDVPEPERACHGFARRSARVRRRRKRPRKTPALYGSALISIMTSATAVALPLLLAASLVSTQVGQPPFEPTVGMPGRDAVWVPTTSGMVAKMLYMAKVTPADLVVDLGSGDGRMVIAAAKRGARARGVEFNPEMVRLSQQRARAAGVGERATFIEGDMFEADISDATVMAVFLLTENMRRLQDRFLALRPGTRIVSNTF